MWTISNKSVAREYVLMIEEGRTVRECSTYDSRQRPRIVTKVRADAAKVVRVRVAEEVAQMMTSPRRSAARTAQAN